jgi:hypothetical protein
VIVGVLVMVGVLVTVGVSVSVGEAVGVCVGGCVGDGVGVSVGVPIGPEVGVAVDRSGATEQPPLQSSVRLSVKAEQPAVRQIELQTTPLLMASTQNPAPQPVLHEQQAACAASGDNTGASCNTPSTKPTRATVPQKRFVICVFLPAGAPDDPAVPLPPRLTGRCQKSQ